jgi:hypothetical protein
MFRCTPDGAAVALVLLALRLQRNRRSGATVAILVAATFVRETSIIAAFAVAWAEVLQRRWRQAIAAVGAPITAFAAWQLYLRLHLAGVHEDRGTGALGLPFAWVPRKLEHLLETGLTAGRMEVLGLIALAACLAALVRVAARCPRWSAAEATFVGFGALALVLSYAVYVEVYAHARVLLALPVLALVLAASESRRGARLLLAAVPLAFALTGVPVLRAEIGLGTVRAAAAQLAGEDAATLPPDAGAPPGEARAVLPEPSPAPPPSPTPTPLPTPQPLYLLPVARASGLYGAQWRTELAVANPTDTATSLTFELLLAGRGDGAPRRARLDLAAGEKRTVPDALGELFGASGSGALRVTRGSEAVTVRARTYDGNAKAPRGPFLEGIAERAAHRPGRPAELHGLAHDPGARTRKRTNLGVLNVGKAAIDVEIVAADAGGGAIGSARLHLEPRGFTQVDDLFQAVGADAPVVGSARVTTSTPGGAFLAYASVVRRDPPSVTYVRPESRPAAGAAVAPPATPAAPSSSTGSPAGGSAPRSPR